MVRVVMGFFHFLSTEDHRTCFLVTKITLPGLQCRAPSPQARSVAPFVRSAGTVGTMGVNTFLFFQWISSPGRKIIVNGNPKHIATRQQQQLNSVIILHIRRNADRQHLFWRRHNFYRCMRRHILLPPQRSCLVEVS